MTKILCYAINKAASIIRYGICLCITLSTCAFANSISPHQPCDMFHPAKHQLSLSDFGLSPNHNKSIQLISVWAVWCGPCRHELPLLDGLQHPQLDVIALNLGDSPDLIAQFTHANHIKQLNLSRQAPENLLDTIHAVGLPYNALFVSGKLYGIRNQALDDASALKQCLASLTHR